MEGKEKEYTIEDFREEALAASQNPENEGDFPEEINPAELTGEDMAIWMKIRDKTIKMSDIAEYKKIFAEGNGFENKTRYNFLMFASNKANVIIGKRETGIN